MKWKAKILITVIGSYLLAVGDSASCEVRLPRLISDGMILQRNATTQLWGWAAPNEKLTINFNGHAYHTSAGVNGKWLTTLPPMKPGGPYEMDITATNHISLHNILVGDVWICSGQSNMVLPMARVKDRYTKEIALAENSAIREFLVPDSYVFSNAQEDLAAGKWISSSPASVVYFTAAGYFFAKALYEKYHVPIGLIAASVGGAPVEAWLSREALKAFPSYLATAEKFANSDYVNRIRSRDNAKNNNWYNHIWQEDQGLQGSKPWFDSDYDASAWSTMTLPGYWSDQGLKDVNGVVWFRKTIEVPPSMINKPARLLLGRIVDRDSVYLNGSFVGTTGYQYPPRKYDIPANLLRPGKNSIVIRVINSSGKGGFVKDKPYQLIAGDQTIDLQGSWQYRLGVAADPLPASTFFQYEPLGLYNGMIAPLINYRIRGVIWYQGESNVSKAGEYQQLFTALITDWRKKWNQGNFPFLYVQLPNFMATKAQPAASDWAELREAQLKTLAVPNTAMAVAIDIGEWNDIHPLDKKDVGDRLALAAERLAYGDSSVTWSGPLYQSMKKKGNKIIISFAHIDGGLILKNGKELKYFAIAGADKKFVWANAKISGGKVIVWNDKIKQPVAVSYAWADNPEGANLYNKAGLPASPFRTDE